MPKKRILRLIWASSYPALKDRNMKGVVSKNCGNMPI
jgi:hypothetical protein